MKYKKTVTVVIPSWNSESQMKQNLPYVFAAAKAVEAEIVIVDDNSKYDDSAGYLKSLGKKIRFYENKKNGGFSVTVNRGVSQAKGDIIMLLNTDVRPSPDCFSKALKYFADNTVYAVGFNSGEAWMGGEWKDGLFHHFKVEPTPMNKNKVNPSLWASGGQAAFDRLKWITLGGMDLLYKPFYWEDTDMGFNSWKRGWQIIWAPDCRCEHDHAQSAIANNFTLTTKYEAAQRNQFLFIWKNISDPFLLLSHLFYLPYYLYQYPKTLFNSFKLLPQALGRRSLVQKTWKRRDRDILKLWTR